MIFQIIIVQVITFAGLVFVLRKILMSTTYKETSHLQQLNEDNKRKAQELDRKIAEAEHQYREKMNKAEDDMRALKVQSQKEIDELREAMIAKGKAESEQIISQALASKKEMRAEIEDEMYEKSVDLCFTILQKILSSEEQKLVYDGLLSSVMTELESMDGQQLKSIELDGDAVDVKTSHPMNAAQKDRLKKILSGKMDRAVTVREQIDHETIAGIVILLGSFVIDGSLAERFRKAARDLR